MSYGNLLLGEIEVSDVEDDDALRPRCTHRPLPLDEDPYRYGVRRETSLRKRLVPGLEILR